MKRRTAVVLGAGLQGICASFALAEAGYDVTLVDRAPDCFLRASLHNEGKIHLGFVYANDPSCRTSSLMLKSAMAFGPLLERWLGGPLPWTDLATDPFLYLVLDDSLLRPDVLLGAWERLQARYEQDWPGGTGSYLGASPARLWHRPDPCDPARRFLSHRAPVIVRTAERAVDVFALRDLVRARLRASDRIRPLYGHAVRTARRTSTGFRVEGTRVDGSGRWTLDAPVVVNCLWEGRLAIDREMGVLPSRPWVYRLKYRLLARLPRELADLPSLTMMLGRFGDIVNFGDRRVYMSWYPTCLRGWSSDVSAPEAWDAACGTGIPLAQARDIAEETLAAFDAIVPGFGACRVDSVAAGIIFSWGATDIDDLRSELHHRHEIGPEAHDGYITVNTGKLTSAPLFGREVVDLLA